MTTMNKKQSDVKIYSKCGTFNTAAQLYETRSDLSEEKLEKPDNGHVKK